MFQQRFWRLAIPSLATLALCVFGVPSALADSITYDLTAQNGALTGSGPYEQVTIDLTSSTTATVTFDGLDSNGFTYLLGGADAADINVNASSFTLSGISSTNSIPGFTSGPVSNDGSGNVSAFGSFNQTLKSFDGFTHSSTEISFMLTDNSGTWSSAADVTKPNIHGNILAAHGFECADPCTVGEGAANTGFVSGADPVTSTPEPFSLSLSALGVGLLGLGALRRRFSA